MKIVRREEKNKKVAYIIGGILSVVVLFFWVTMPLMDKSSWDASVVNPYGMSKKSADLAFLDSAGVDAPGSPLSGALIDNPATRLDLEASSLFKMPESEIKYEESSSTSQISSTFVDSDITSPGPTAGSNPQANISTSIYWKIK